MTDATSFLVWLWNFHCSPINLSVAKQPVFQGKVAAGMHSMFTVENNNLQ